MKTQSMCKWNDADGDYPTPKKENPTPNISMIFTHNNIGFWQSQTLFWIFLV